MSWELSVEESFSREMRQKIVHPHFQPKCYLAYSYYMAGVSLSIFIHCHIAVQIEERNESQRKSYFQQIFLLFVCFDFFLSFSNRQIRFLSSCLNAHSFFKGRLLWEEDGMELKEFFKSWFWQGLISHHIYNFSSVNFTRVVKMLKIFSPLQSMRRGALVIRFPLSSKLLCK